MVALPKKAMKIFGQNAGTNERGVIGSFAAGSPTYSTDPDVIQSLANYLQGWYGVVVGQNSPAIQDMNALDFLVTRQLAYLYERGVAEWGSDTTYYIGSIVSDGLGQQYVSIANDNTGNALTDDTKWRVFQDDSAIIQNLSIAASVGSNALTIALKTKAGADPSASSPVRIGFRNSTLTLGTYNVRSITSALSVVVSSGSTLGQTNGTAYPIYVYLIDNAGTPELAVSTSLFDTGSVVSTTAEGGAGGADTFNVIYSTTARSNVPIRLIGKLISTQATAGTWATAPSVVTTTMLDTPMRVFGTVDGAQIPQGYLGSKALSSGPAADFAVTPAATWVTPSSITVPRGLWDIKVYGYVSGTASLTAIQFGISTDSGANSFSDVASRTNPERSNLMSLACVGASADIAGYFEKPSVLVTTDTIYYYKARAIGVAAAAGMYVEAVRK